MRRRALLAASAAGGGVDLNFPLYFKSVEGSGKVRTVETNADSLKLTQLLDEHHYFDGNWFWVDDEYYNQLIMFVDDIAIMFGGDGIGNVSTGEWVAFTLRDHPSNTVGHISWWNGFLYRDGRITVYDDY